MIELRDFLYLDDQTVDRLLSGIERGRFDSVDQAWESPSDGQVSEQRTIRQTPEARFSRLWDVLSGDEGQVLDVTQATEETWNSATESRFCKFTGRLSVPPIVLGLAVAESLRNFMQLGRQAGLIPISGNEDEILEKMASMRDLIKETFPVVLRTAGSEIPILMPLDIEHSRVRVDRYTGRATVVGRVLERTQAGDSLEVLQIPGITQINKMNRNQRRAAERAGQKTQPADGMQIDGPALTLRVVAVYQ